MAAIANWPYETEMSIPHSVVADIELKFAVVENESFFTPAEYNSAARWLNG